MVTKTEGEREFGSSRPERRGENEVLCLVARYEHS